MDEYQTAIQMIEQEVWKSLWDAHHKRITWPEAVLKVQASLLDLSKIHKEQQQYWEDYNEPDLK